MAELRKDIITGRWVIVSTGRGKRPEVFLTERKREKEARRNCPFCSGNEHMTPPEIRAVRPEAHAEPNTPGWKVRVIPNKFPALGIVDDVHRKQDGVDIMMSGFGAHEVIIESPEHTHTAKDLSLDHLSSIITVWQDRVQDLYKDERFHYVLVFKNEGEDAGASQEHVHSQLIGTPVTPKRVGEELRGSGDYYTKNKRCVFCDVIHHEKEFEKRIVYENDSYVAFCPYASRFPFEMCVLPKEHQADFYASRNNVKDMAYALKIVFLKLAQVLDEPQYNFLIHTSPNRDERPGYWTTIQKDYHWHIEIIPRVERIAGFEWGTGMYINPIQPEDAAQYLRESLVMV